MKRVSAVFAAVVAAAALAAGTSAAPDAKGPPCTNFTFGDAGYSATTGTVTADMTLAAPACAEATYSLDIYNLAGTTLLAEDVAPTQPVSGTIVSFSHTFTSGAPSDGVCLVVQSFFRGRLVDTAPNSGCERVTPTSGGGSSNFA